MRSSRTHLFDQPESLCLGLTYLAAWPGVRRRQRATTTRPDPSRSAAIPTSHSSDSSAPVKAICALVAGEATGGKVPGLGVETGVVAGVVATNEPGAVTATLPGTYVIV